MKKLLLITISIAGFYSGILAQPHYKDVANIIYTRCGNCHNQYTHGANFMGYSFVTTNGQGMKSQLEKGTMPPWLPDTTYGTRFVHEYIITKAEKDLLLKWVTDGMPAGDTTKAPPPPNFGKHYINAPADLELSIGDYTSTSKSQDNYICFALPTGLKEDRFLKAIEIVAGNPKIVHHVLVGVDTTGTIKSDFGGSCFQMPGQYGLSGFAPGALPTIFPNRAPLKAGIRIKAGSQIVLQIHYPIKSDGQKDNTKVRLFFYPKGETGVRHVFVETVLQKWFGLDIPANKVTTHTESNEYAFMSGNNGSHPKWNYDASLFAVFPHSHAICTYIENTAEPNTGVTGSPIPLVRINKWDFNREGFFTYRKMVKIPNGYHLVGKHVYDNTDGNFANPNHPPKSVSAGPATADEMLFDSFMWLKYQPGDENIDVDSLIKTDPLASGFYPGPELPGAAFESYSFPNPFKNSVTIGYELTKTAAVEINIWSVAGEVVKTIKPGNQQQGKHELIWDGTNNKGEKLAAGQYIYNVKAGEQSSHGRLAFIP